MKKHWLLLILIVAIFLLLCWSLWWSNYGLKTVRYTVGGKSLPKGFNGYHIVQLSDLHSVSLGEENGRLLKAIRAEKPDIIVMTGDMVSRYDEDFSVTLALCSALAEEYPVYYIRGNHEEGLATADWESYRAVLAASRVQVLDNETVQLTAENGDRINLTGLWYKLDYYHGGMIWLPLLGGILSPETILFPEYDGGSYQIEDKTMILSRGLGRGRMGIRLFNPPELVCVTLTREE